jgi:hypothetical protein
MFGFGVKAKIHIEHSKSYILHIENQNKYKLPVGKNYWKIFFKIN